MAVDSIRTNIYPEQVALVTIAARHKRGSYMLEGNWIFLDFEDVSPLI